MSDPTITGQRRKWPDDYLDPDDAAGIACRKCGCKHFRTTHTRPLADGSVRRYKICRHCGTTNRTVERAG